MRFLLTADWHVQGERPRCRRDPDWLLTQQQAIRFVVDLANERECPLFILGDIFNTPRVATPVVVMLGGELLRAKVPVRILAGNHDLPYHRYENVNDCSFGILRQYFQELTPTNFHWNDQITAAPFGKDNGDVLAWIAFTHQLVFPDEASRPGPAVGKTASELCDQFPNARWIFTGDYHHAFDVEVLPARLEGYQDGDPGDLVRVVNPGCLLRQAADMLNYQPKVAIVDTDEGTVEWVDVPDPGELQLEGVVTDDYLREAEVRDEKVSAFIEAIQSRGAVSLSFRENLLKALDDPTITTGVREIVLEVLNNTNLEK